MDTHTLTAFIAVARHQSFSIAAQELFITQSAISKRVALLEDQLSQKLFDRIGRQVTLTSAGEALLPCAENILMSFADARTVINNLDEQVQGRLTLASSHHIGLHRLPSVLRQFSQAFPRVELNLSFGESEAAYDGVVKGYLELALITLAPSPNAAICAEKVWTDTLEFVVAKDHVLAEHSKVTLKELAHFHAILPDTQTFTRQIAVERFTEQNLPLIVPTSTNYLDTIKMMVSTGLGWSLLPRSMIDDSLTVLKTDQMPIHRELGFIYHRDRTLSNAAKQFIKLLQ